MPPRTRRRRGVKQKRAYTPTRGVFASRRFPDQGTYRAALRARRKEIPAEADRVRRMPIYTLEQANRLTAEEEDEWIRSLEALNLVRRKRMGVTRAARNVGLPESIILKHVSPALTTDARGRIRAKPHDNLLRVMPFWTTRGQIPLPTYDSRKASLVGRHNWAVRQYIEGRGRTTLDQFEGQSIRVGRETYPFITDPLTLKRLHQRDIPEYEGYSRTI